jgi:hypothetical protein
MTISIETFIGEGITQIVGSMPILGIFFIAFFVIFTMLQNTRIDGKMAILIPVLFMAGAFFDFMIYLLVIFLAFILALAISKINRSM